MADLADLTADDFAAHAGSRYLLRVAGASEAIPLELVEVTAGRHGRRGGRPFSVVFRGPRSPSLPQAQYRLEHAAMGELDIFLVPIALDAEGLRYEAVFN